jgi:hypothetical protein
LNDKLQPTKFETVETDRDQAILREKEIELGDGIDKDEVNAKLSPEIERVSDESDIDVIIRL